MSRRGKQEFERDLLRRVAALGPPDPDRASEDELLAALVDRTESLDDADAATLGRALARDGTEFIAELLADPPRFESAERHGLQLVRGPRPQPIALPVHLRMAAAAVGMLGAGLLAFVLSQGSGGRADGWLRTDDLGPTGRPFTAAGTLGDAGTRWGAELRGDLDADLARRLVVIAASSDLPFGCGVQLADGWIVTASSVVERAVQAASWSGEAARVDVWITADGAAPLAESRRATVHRHRPARGLSLLRLDDGGDANLAPVPVVGPADGAQVLWLVASQSLEAPVRETATWSARAPEAGASWPRQAVGSATLRPLAAEFEAGAPGSPVLVDEPTGLALAGILADESGRVVGAADLRALLAGADAGRAPELWPVDPWSLAPGEAMLPVPPPAGSTDWIGRVDSPTDPRVVVFRAAAEPTPDALPRDGFATGASDARPVDLFVVQTDDGRLAIGTCDAAGQVVRIWGGERSRAMASWTWSRDLDGTWRRETSSRGIPFVNPAWLDRAQVRWLQSALGR